MIVEPARDFLESCVKRRRVKSILNMEIFCKEYRSLLAARFNLAFSILPLHRLSVDISSGTIYEYGIV